MRWPATSSQYLVAGLLALALPGGALQVGAVQGGDSGPLKALQIVGPEGLPVVGATLEVRTPPPSEDLVSRLLGPVAGGVTNQDGRLEEPLPALEDLLLIVNHPKFLPFVAFTKNLASEIVILDPGRIWEGRVEPGGDRAHDGFVCATWEEERDMWGTAPPWRRCSLIAADGAFQLNGLPDGWVRVSIQASGAVPLEMRAQVGQPTLQLKRGTTVIGRVFDLQRQPVRSARVALARSGPGRPTNETTSGADGRFQLQLLQLPATVSVEAAGFQRQTLRVQGDEEALEILLRPGREVLGILVGDQGQPVPTARVLVERRDANGLHARQIPLELKAGAFRLPLHQAGPVLLRFEAPGYGPWTTAGLEVAPGESLDLGVVELDRGASVAGQVLDGTTGEPIPRAVVTLLPQGIALIRHARDADLVRTLTEMDGRFALPGLTPGGYEVRIEHQGRAIATRRFLISPNETVDLGAVTLSAGRAVQGTFTTPGREAPAMTTLRFYDPAHTVLIPLATTTALRVEDSRATEAKLSFDGPTLAPGRYRMTVDAGRRLLTQEIVIPPGKGPFPIDLELTTVRLRGEVRRGGEAVGDAFITLEAALDPAQFQGKVSLSHSEVPGRESLFGAIGGHLSATSNGEGRFLMQDVPAGPAWMTITTADSRSPVHRLVDIPNQPEAALILDLAGTTLQGYTLDASSGASVPGQVRVIGPSGRAIATTTANQDGLFFVRDLVPGKYTLEARREGYGMAEVLDFLVEPAVEPDAPPVELRLHPGTGGTLQITLTREDGSSLDSIMTTLLTASGRMAAAGLTDREGRRTFHNLAPGTYFVAWSDPVAGTGVTAAFEILAGKMKEEALSLPRGEAFEVACPLESCAGAPVRELRLATSAGLDLFPYLSGADARLRFADDGTLSLGQVAPGRYLLRVATEGNNPWQRPVVITGP